jgi:hypothetical protein
MSDESKLLFKVLALEFLMIERLVTEYLRSPDPAATASTRRESLRELFSQVALPGTDAALSDFAVGEVGDEVDRIVAHAQETAVQKADARKRS